MPLARCQCEICDEIAPVDCVATLDWTRPRDGHVCAGCGAADSMAFPEDGSVSLRVDDAPAIDQAVCILGQLSPRWCRVRNFHLRDHGRLLSKHELGTVLSRLVEEGLFEKRVDPSERVVQYRPTADGLEAFYSLMPDERP